MRDSMSTVSVLDSNANRLQLPTADESLLKRFLTTELRALLCSRKTRFGTSLEDVIRSGVENADSKIGIYASDTDAYSIFALLFDRVIESYHSIQLSTLMSKPYTPLSGIERRGFSEKVCGQVVSIRIRACRSLADFPLNGKMSRQDYQDVEARILNAVSQNTHRPAELVGNYYPQTMLDNTGTSTAQISDEDSIMLKRTKGLWPEPILEDKYLCSAGASNHYPVGRGVYINQNQDLSLWINEEDHLRVMAVRPGADLQGVLHLLDTILTFLEHQTTNLKFAFDKRLGYMTFCPSNLGTTIRLSVLIHLPQFDARPERLQQLAKKYHLQIRGVAGEHSSLEDGGGIYDVSNARRLGLSEVDLINEMIDGVVKLALDG